MATHKHVLFHAAAREKVLEGATALADAVRVTLGPKSRCVLIGHRWGTPLVCDDGVTIAKEFQLEDAEQELGVRMIRQAAERTGEAVGDGTSTATILAHAIFRDGLRNVVAGASAVDLKRGLDRGLEVAVAHVRARSRPVTTHDEKVQVATVSAHDDKVIGSMVAEALERVGAEGAITVEEAKGTETSLEVVDGMQLDRGWLSPYFVTDPTRMECVLERPLVLLCEKRISAMKDLLGTLEHVAKHGRALLIVAEDVDGEALATLVVNRLRGTLSVAAVKAPGFGDRRKAMMEDIATLTGARVVAEELGLTLEHLQPEHLGECARAVLSRETATLVGGLGDKEGIEGRKAHLRAEIQRTKSDYDREKLEERLARLSGGVAVIKVGAPSEAEMKRRKEGIEDAIHAARAAVAEGIVPGAGLALLRAIPALEAEAEQATGDVKTGILLLRHALEAPTRQIAENSGVDAGVVVDRMRSGANGFGFDAARGVYVDLLGAGIVDPTKVVRMALENAVSVASVLLLTEATLTEVESEPRGEHAAADLE